jgi:cation transporter-like permease
LPEDEQLLAGRLYGEVRMNGIVTLVLSLLAMLAGAAGFAWYVWRELGDVEISLHGYIALAAGVTVTLGLGVGLMWLVYFSHRRGFDDEVGRD